MGRSRVGRLGHGTKPSSSSQVSSQRILLLILFLRRNQRVAFGVKGDLYKSYYVVLTFSFTDLMRQAFCGSVSVESVCSCKFQENSRRHFVIFSVRASIRRLQCEQQNNGTLSVRLRINLKDPRDATAQSSPAVGEMSTRSSERLENKCLGETEPFQSWSLLFCHHAHSSHRNVPIFIQIVYLLAN